MKTANVSRASFLYNMVFYYFVIPQRSETVVCVTCIVPALAATFAFSFCLDESFQPAKNKEQLGQQNLTFVFITHFPAATL